MDEPKQEQQNRWASGKAEKPVVCPKKEKKKTSKQSIQASKHACINPSCTVNIWYIV